MTHAAMQTAPRCGARTRNGQPCQAPRIRGRPRCRMHGGHVLSGAPRANRNALTHGASTAEAEALNRALDAALKRMREGLG